MDCGLAGIPLPQEFLCEPLHECTSRFHNFFGRLRWTLVRDRMPEIIRRGYFVRLYEKMGVREEILSSKS